MTTEGGVEVMMTEGGVEVQLERERQGRGRERRIRSDLYRPRGAGWPPTPKLGVITRIGRSDWPRPPVRPSRDGRKQQHYTSSKGTPRRKDD